MKTFCGYSEEAAFLKEKYDDFIKARKGELIISIGSGNFDQYFYTIMQMTMAYGAYNNEKNK